MFGPSPNDTVNNNQQQPLMAPIQNGEHFRRGARNHTRNFSVTIAYKSALYYHRILVFFCCCFFFLWHDKILFLSDINRFLFLLFFPTHFSERISGLLERYLPIDGGYVGQRSLRKAGTRRIQDTSQ
jgi:hypothetical protein